MQIVWTPTWIAWLIDTTVYRNSTSAPWRPVTMRPLLRTNIGTAASVAKLPDANVYVRRVRYTPLNWPGSPNVVNDALTLPSFASKYGPLANNAAGMLQMSTPGMAAAAAGHRRRLMQLGGMGPQLDVSGTVLANPSAAVVAATGYAAELLSVSNTTQHVVAAAIPGVVPSMVAVTITGAIAARCCN